MPFVGPVIWLMHLRNHSCKCIIVDVEHAGHPMNTTAIANHLNVAASAIVEVQDWARVLWVRVKGLGARFVSKKVVEAKGMKLLIQDGGGYGCSIVANGEKVYYSSAAEISPEMGIVAGVLGGFYDHQHCQIALDAGGVVTKSSTNKWDEVKIEEVRVTAELLIAYCKRLESARNPHAGMMQTSIGKWVLADDWDAIEEQH